MKGYLARLLCAFGVLISFGLHLEAQDASNSEEPKEPFLTWGHVQTFRDGLKFNFRVERNRLHVYFIDEEEQLVTEPVVARINARLDPRIGDSEFVVLRFRSGISAYTGPLFVRKPFIMGVNMALIGEDGEGISSFQFLLNHRENSEADAVASKEE
ncbi:MAG: hypothetical protein AAF212_07240 [Verrucomicrobiota bacterium]